MADGQYSQDGDRTGGLPFGYDLPILNEDDSSLIESFFKDPGSGRVGDLPDSNGGMEAIFGMGALSGDYGNWSTGSIAHTPALSNYYGESRAGATGHSLRTSSQPSVPANDDRYAPVPSDGAENGTFSPMSNGAGEQSLHGNNQSAMPTNNGRYALNPFDYAESGTYAPLAGGPAGHSLRPSHQSAVPANDGRYASDPSEDVENGALSLISMSDFGMRQQPNHMRGSLTSDSPVPHLNGNTSRHKRNRMRGSITSDSPGLHFTGSTPPHKPNHMRGPLGADPSPPLPSGILSSPSNLHHLSQDNNIHHQHEMVRNNNQSNGRQQQHPNDGNWDQQHPSNNNNWRQQQQQRQRMPYHTQDNNMWHLGQSQNTSQQQQQMPRTLPFNTDNSFTPGGYMGPPNQPIPGNRMSQNLAQVPYASEARTQMGSMHGQSGHMQQQPSLRRGFPGYPHPVPTAPTFTGGFPNGPNPTNYTHPFAPNQHMPQYSDRNGYNNSIIEQNNAMDLSLDLQADPLPIGRPRRTLPAEFTGEHARAQDMQRTSSMRSHPTTSSEEDYQLPAATTDTTKRKHKRKRAPPSKRANTMAPSADTSSPAGSSASTPRKGAGVKKRTTLTKEQKRANHIKSEKARRDAIKGSYDRLEDMVPNLQHGKSGLSRAEVVAEIAEFTETLADGNDIIQRLLNGEAGDVSGTMRSRGPGFEEEDEGEGGEEEDEGAEE